MTRKYVFTAHTPFFGEEQDCEYLVEYDTEEELEYLLEKFAEEWALENGDEWWDFSHERVMSEEGYFEGCYCTWEEKR